MVCCLLFFPPVITCNVLNVPLCFLFVSASCVSLPFAIPLKPIIKYFLCHLASCHCICCFVLFLFLIFGCSFLGSKVLWSKPQSIKASISSSLCYSDDILYGYCIGLKIAIIILFFVLPLHSLWLISCFIVYVLCRFLILCLDFPPSLFSIFRPVYSFSVP